MCSMSVRAERCIFSVWWYSVRVYALVCQACAFACALINILPTLVECRITRKRNFGSIGSCCIVCGCSVIASDSVQGSTTFDDDAILSSNLLNKHDAGENRTSVALAAPSHTNMAVMSVTKKRNTLGQHAARVGRTRARWAYRCNHGRNTHL